VSEFIRCCGVDSEWKFCFLRDQLPDTKCRSSLEKWDLVEEYFPSPFATLQVSVPVQYRDLNVNQTFDTPNLKFVDVYPAQHNSTSHNITSLHMTTQWKMSSSLKKETKRKIVSKIEPSHILRRLHEASVGN
jgi:hypothetical protein